MAVVDVVRRRVVVTGRVQGVWFRETCRRVARAEGVAGWVRNRPDGRVEAVFEGAADAVERLVRWAGEGPDHAVVVHVDVEPEPAEGLTDFEVR